MACGCGGTSNAELWEFVRPDNTVATAGTKAEAQEAQRQAGGGGYIRRKAV